MKASLWIKPLIGITIVVNFAILIIMTHSNFMLKLLKKKIIIDSRASKIKFFIFSLNLFNNWNDVIVSLPVIRVLKRYANRHSMAFVLVGASEELLSYLFSRGYIDGYIFSEELFYTRRIFIKCFSATICIDYKQITEKRTFHNIFSYINFFSNNYAVSKIEWVNLIIANNFFLWLFKMTNPRNIYIHVQLYKWRTYLYNILFFANLQLWLIASSRMLIYNTNIFEIMKRVGRKYQKTFHYKPCLGKSKLRDGRWKMSSVGELQKRFSSINISEQKYCVVGISDEDNYTLWPPLQFAKLMILVDKYLKLKIIIIFQHSSYFIEPRNWYIKKVKSCLVKAKSTLKVNSYYFSSDDWENITCLTASAQFCIAYSNMFMTFFYHTGKSCILITGNLRLGINYPIRRNMLAPNQTIFWAFQSKSEMRFVSWFQKKLNLVHLKLLKAEIIFRLVKQLYEQKNKERQQPLVRIVKKNQRKDSFKVRSDTSSIFQ